MTQKIALGTAQFGLAYGIANQTGQVQEDRVRDILAHAQSSGIRILDTAIAYGNSEATLGSVGVNGYQVVTKLPGIPEGVRDVVGWVHQSVEDSLAKLKLDRLYGLLLHRPNELFGPSGKALARALHGLQDQARVEKLGVSIYQPDDLIGISDCIPLNLVQSPLNLMDQRLLHSGWADRLKSNGTELHVRSVFLQGLLLMPPDKRPAQFSQWPEVWEVWDRWLATQDMPVQQVCTTFALNLPQVDQVVIGVDSLAQLREIVAAKPEYLKDLPEWKGTIPEQLLNPALWRVA